MLRFRSFFYPPLRLSRSCWPCSLQSRSPFSTFSLSSQSLLPVSHLSRQSRFSVVKNTSAHAKLLSTIAPANPSKRHLVSGGFRLLWRATKISYATLSLIPLSLTVAAGYHWTLGHPTPVVRAHLFFAWTGYLCLPLSALLLCSFPVVYVLDGEKRSFLDWIQRAWGQLTCLPFFIPEVVGLDKIAPMLEEGEAVVYVSNHQSWADIYALLWIPHPIRFVSKSQIFWIPVVGWCMGLIGHVGVHRASKGSRSAVVDTCVDKVKSGVSVFIFAEGTRSKDGLVQKFKRGAFVIAKKANAKIVPISISGTGKLMPPNRGETWLERGEDVPVLIEIHETIDPMDYETVEDLQEATRQRIEAGVRV